MPALYPSNRIQQPYWTQSYADLIRQWDVQGFTPATSSNFSGREPQASLPNPVFWVSRSGVDKASFTGPDFIPVDAKGQSLTDETPSAETLLHAVIYQHLPQAQFVAHTHSPTLTVLSRRLPQQQPDWLIQGYELQKAFEGQNTHLTPLTVPIWPNSQHMPDIAENLTAWLDQGQRQDQGQNHAPGFLIAGHGLYTWANSLEALKRHVTTFEFLARCTLDYP